MGDSLFHAILDFYEWSITPRGGGKPIEISLNDMSLPFGGLFDGVNANWQVPHITHRIGRSVDINNTIVPFQIYDPHNPNKPIVTKAGKELQRLMNLHLGFRIIDGKSVHYEFYSAN